jgi:ribose transport system permease protein
MNDIATKEPARTAGPPPATAPRRTRLHTSLSTLADRLGVTIALIVIVVLFALCAPHFLTVVNLLDVARQISVTAILGAGLTFVIMTAGIDLSVGSAVGVTAFAAVALTLDGAPAPLALAVALLAGIVIGLINGALVAQLRLAAFIVTLAALTYLRGVTYVGTDGTTLFSTHFSYGVLGQGSVLGLPVPVVVMVAVFAIGWYVLEQTVFGRWVHAVGGNAEARGWRAYRCDVSW